MPLLRFSEAIDKVVDEYLADAENEAGVVAPYKDILKDFVLYAKYAHDFDAPFDDVGDGSKKYVVLTEDAFGTTQYVLEDWTTFHNGNGYEALDFDLTSADPDTAYDDYLAVVEAANKLLPDVAAANRQLIDAVEILYPSPEATRIMVREQCREQGTHGGPDCGCYDVS